MINFILYFELIMKKSDNKGIALVAILAILTVLAIMATAFIVQMRIESKMTETLLIKERTSMLMLAATEHAKAQLFNDTLNSPNYDSLEEPWHKCFYSATDNNKKTVKIDDAQEQNSKWFYVKNKSGAVIGRYAVNIEDEAGKINANAAASINRNTQNQGIQPNEIMLTDGRNIGIPISKRSAKKIINFRYGRDKKPGQANVDDNANNVSFMYDGIDNNGNGIIDEPDEGIDEPQEYNPLTPYWDDQSFGSVNDVASLIGLKNSKSKSYLKKYCTVSSYTRDTFWNDAEQKMQLPINLNVSTTRQLHKVLKRGNKKKPFEGSSKNLRVLAANITDYRDENQVLTTMGSDYGIESICFNEIMAVNGNYTLESDFEGWAPRFGFWFAHYSETRPNYRYNYKRAWKIKKVIDLKRKRNASRAGEKLKLSTAKVFLDEPQSWDNLGGSRNLYHRLTKGGWLPNVFKNAVFILVKDKAGSQRLYYPVVGNDKNSITIGYNNSKDYNLAELTNSNPNIRVEIDTLWWPHAASFCLFPEQTEIWWVPTQFDPKIKRPDSLYYYLYLAEQSFNYDLGPPSYFHWPLVGSDSPRQRPYKGYYPYMDTDGIPNSYSETRMEKITAADLKGTTLELPNGVNEMDLLRTPYKNGEAIRAQNGYIQVCITSSKNCGYVGGVKKTSDRKAFANKHCIDAMYVMRPDIVELINISDHPISLNNWQIIVNTGDAVNRVGLIRNIPHYSVDRHGRYNDPNPTIPPHGYFYLTNNRNFFDKVYGTMKSGTWGDSQSEEYGVYELPKALWGVRYKIINVKSDHVKVKGANWKTDQMKGELVEFQSTKPHPKSNGISGIRRGIVGNTKDTLILNVDAYGTGVRKGDDAILVGLPGAGGFLSFSLKNEYNQIAARIVEYGSLDPSEITYSTQKIDPTRYDWQISKNPTFGGKEELARNHGVASNTKLQANIKNNRYSSLVELQKVKTAKKFENIGTGKGGKGSFQILKAIGNYLTTSGIRLDPEEKYVHISGWKPAFAAAALSKSGTVKAKNASWTPNMWQYQKLRILTGPQRGETFLITANTENSITVDGYSVPSGKILRINKGDSFSVGPGYATPMFYTRKEAEEGVWEWKHRDLHKTYYGLYLAGLNDSIDTTEFLEENYNAQIEVQIYNFKNGQYDKLPLDFSDKVSNDIYGKPGSKIGRFQYEKSDMVFCGFIGPDHISPEKGVRVKLISHGLNNKKCSGIAWFDYLYLAPGSSYGKININTATPRVLQSLNDITPTIAKNIYQGINNFNKPALKPYKSITDILDVKGMTDKIFSDICNLITTRSDQFRVNIIAQTLKPSNKKDKNGKPLDYQVVSTEKRSMIIDRSNLTSIAPSKKEFETMLDN